MFKSFKTISQRNKDSLRELKALEMEIRNLQLRVKLRILQEDTLGRESEIEALKVKISKLK